MATAAHGKVLRRADPSTIQDKFLVGYQGWFTCPGDGQPLDPHHHGWLHWMNYPIPDGGRPNTDLWPDVSEYSPSELYPAAGLKYKDGEQAYLFSSRNPKTVQRHFHWMALHGVDGAFLQRFAGQCDLEAGNLAIRNQRDEVGDRVREAAEKEGRVFAIMYDVTGVAPDRIQRVIERDWSHLVREKGILDSPSYLREKGKVVVALWGFGFADSRHHPQTVKNVANYIRSNTPGGAYLIAGVPAHWRTSNSDADPNPDFVNVWLEEFDAISPWTIGRYKNLEEADRFAQEKIKGDLELIRKKTELFETGRGGTRKIDYMPVIFPGGSGFNMTEGKWGWNDMPRRGGNFLWRQLFNVRRQNVRIVYGAMWDEYDEGTAFMPVVQNKRQVPKNDKYNFMALDEDGFDLPPDWYLRICGFAVEGLRSERMIHETFPNKELQDYWSSRPRYEEGAVSSGSSSSASHGYGVGVEKEIEKEEKQESWEEWQKKEEEKEKEKADEPPPPPYSLEAELAEAPAQQAITQPPVTQPSVSQPPATFSSTPIAQAPPAQVAVQPNIRGSSLNAFPGHNNAPPHPATPPANTRPASSASPVPSNSSGTAAAPHHTPPPVGSANSRPARQPTGASPPPSNWSSPSGGQGAAASVSSLTDDFSRQTLTSSPQRSEPLGPHAAQAPVSSCGTGSSSVPQVQSSTRPINPFAAPPTAGQPYGPSSFYHQTVPQSQPQFNSPYGSGYAPNHSSGVPYGVPGGPGGFAPTLNRHESMSMPASGSGTNTGTWSQSAWPPPEFGQQQQQPQLPYQPYHPKRHPNQPNQQFGYQSSYAPGYGQPSGPPLLGGPAPTSTLQSRPSVSGPHGYPATPLAHSTSNPERNSTLPYLSGPESSADQSSSPAPHVPLGPPQTTSSPPPLQGSSPPPVPSKSSSVYSTGSDVGGFSFPQAQPSVGTQDFYNTPQQGPGPGQGHGPPYPHHQGSGYFGQGGVEGAGGYPPYGQPAPTGFTSPGSEGYGTPGGFAPGPPNFPSPAANYPPPPVHASYPTYAIGSTSYSSAGFSGFSTRDLSQGLNVSANYFNNQMARATSHGGSLHSLAQSSEKWFGKLKK